MSGVSGVRAAAAVSVVPAPEVLTSRTPGGLRLAATPLRTVPLLQARLALRLPLHTPADLAASDVVAACWSLHPATARLEQAGGIAAASRRRDWLLLGLHATADLQPLMAQTLADLVHATFDARAVERAVTLVTRQAAAAASQPSVHATRLMWSQYYGHLPPAVDPAPDPALTAAVTPDDVTEAFARFVSPHRGHLALVGAAEPEQVMARFAAAVSGWTDRSQDRFQDPAPGTAGRPRPAITTGHRPGQEQARIRLVAPAPPRRGLQDYAAHQIAATVLGGSFSSRINTVLRERDGLAYRCRAATDYVDRDVVVIEADVHTRHAPRAMLLLRDLTEEFATTGPTEEEFLAARGYVTGAYAINAGSQSGRASLLTAAVTQDLPTALTEVPRAVARLTLADVRAAAAHFAPDRFSGAVCADAADLPGSWPWESAGPGRTTPPASSSEG
ncbi:M16 family metallopeptidase [Streptomyces sp. NPDC060048]|uniref:M16 family metallopeptidase n=1 Tax=unclassified Streptomyces TaxID=2593676 RepID=UPI0036775122